MLRFLIAILYLLITLPATAGPAIRIGVSGPFTGSSSLIGLSMRGGIRIAAAEINASGGILGRPIELIERDDEARNEVGAQVVQDMINNERIVAALGIVNTGVALASQRYYQQARIPVITSVATGTLITRQFLPPEHPDNFIFRAAANDTIQAAMIVVEAIERRKLERVAIFHDATNYGLLGREDLETALAAHGMEAVTIERFEIRQADMSQQLKRAHKHGAQAILTYGIGPELAQIANGMVSMNWQVPLVGSWTLAMSNFIDSAGPNAEGARMPQTFIPEPTTPRRKAFLDAWQNQTGTHHIPVPPAAAQGYDSLQLLAAAIRQAGSVNGDRIREALEDLRKPVEGVIMTYNHPYTRDNHETISSAHDIFMGEVHNGVIVFAYPEDRHQASHQ